jgi:hypothetical protein
MSRPSEEQGFEESQTDADRQLRCCAKAISVSALAFVLVLGLLWLNHPLLLQRHLDRVLMQCGIAALIAFVAIWFVDSLKKPGS